MRRSKTLKDLATRSIITKLCTHLKGGGHNLAKLPACLRESLLLELVKRRSNKQYGEEQKRNLPLTMRKAVSLLISSETKKFEFGGLLSYTKRNNVLRNTFKILQILTRAPNLEHLIINVKEKFENHHYPLLEERSIQAISRMENLKILKIIEFAVKYDDMKSICKVLKKLQYVEFFHIDFSDTRLEDLGADIEDFKSSFSRLTVILFESARVMLCPFERKLKRLCLQNLPNLKIIYKCQDYTNFDSPLEESLIPVEPCVLRHLCISPSTSDLPSVFPEVTNLHVRFPRNEITDEDKLKSILRFSSIECLLLNFPPTFSIFERVIGAYGANLHTLIIIAVEITDGESPSFSRIFASCPKLQKLVLSGVDISDYKKPIDTFAPLREFEWTPYDTGLQTFEVTNILSALPNLEKITLSDLESLEVDDLKKLASNIKENKILGKLTEIKLIFPVCGHFESDDDRVLLRAVRDIIANAVAYLPALVDIELYLGYRLNSLYQDQIRKIGEKFQELIGDDSIVKFIRTIENRKIG
ncbi:uncharacterized protein LOC135937189 [Cloeon dipterum]|uniref:uncharacterized protein LOC135937189 n=1 Tax=Cloeon dipterum TaxID=197152 RepID=UPI00321F79E4